MLSLAVICGKSSEYSLELPKKVGKIGTKQFNKIRLFSHGMEEIARPV